MGENSLIITREPDYRVAGGGWSPNGYQRHRWVLILSLNNPIHHLISSSLVTHFNNILQLCLGLSTDIPISGPLIGLSNFASNDGYRCTVNLCLSLSDWRVPCALSCINTKHTRIRTIHVGVCRLRRSLAALDSSGNNPQD